MLFVLYTRLCVGVLLNFMTCLLLVTEVSELFQFNFDSFYLYIYFFLFRLGLCVRVCVCGNGRFKYDLYALRVVKCSLTICKRFSSLAFMSLCVL